MKHFTRRSKLYAAALASVAGLATVTLAATAGAAPATASADSTAHKKPTVVLVHGAFADASSWNGVIKRLEHDGYPVVAPANPLRGLNSDSAYLAALLKSVKGPVFLVGHSYGGAVISQAADHDPNVKALVYIAAFSPAKGESASELAGKFPGSTLGATLNKVPFPLEGGGTGTDLYIDPAKFHDQFAADVPRATAALMAATQRPIAASALDEKATEAAWKTIPSWDLITTQDKNIPAAAQRFMAKRAHSHSVEIKASHAVSVSHPGAVTDLVEEASAATVR
ncbi:alpha/beta fold hydrolase [Streptomyces sp. NPDC002573]|uniref:alpha/beta fold hydrolase n=1 Tax=Streptomyces sp. NPDC002573 TaxID=3364651 RepID=UPI00367E6872